MTVTANKKPRRACFRSAGLCSLYRISPEGLERLNVKVENDCGAFIVQATTEDGTLRIKAEKRINHKTEPVANWEKLLEITDAANSYEALSIVFQATINPPTSPTTGY